MEECKGLSRQLSEKNKKLEKLSLVLASMERALVISGWSASLLLPLPHSRSRTASAQQEICVAAVGGSLQRGASGRVRGDACERAANVLD